MLGFLTASDWADLIPAALAVVATIILACIAHRTLDATREYVKATKDLVNITHNPVISVELRPIDFNVKNINQVVFPMYLRNIGNAPAIQIRFLTELIFKDGQVLASSFGTVVAPNLAPDEKTERLGHFEQEERQRLLNELLAARARFGVVYRGADILDKFYEFLRECPTYRVTVFYQNHRNQYFQCKYYSRLAPHPWFEEEISELRFIRGMLFETTEYQDLSDEQYRAIMVEAEKSIKWDEGE